MPASEARAVGHAEAGKKKRLGRLNRFNKRNMQLYDAAVNNKFFAGFARAVSTGGNRVTTGRQVACCLFTGPELARIGLSETEAEAERIAYRLFKAQWKPTCVHARFRRPAGS
jgi:pyruvate/2-oxoglutarate dehydrogenase complex dihydrolipoamide dehydrogenase (E3) component